MRIVRNLVGIWEKKVRNLFRHSTEHRVHTHTHTLFPIRSQTEELKLKQNKTVSLKLWAIFSVILV